MIVNTIKTPFLLVDEFRKYGRDKDYSLDALLALFDYLDGLSEDIGQDIELDVIALCCEWQEFDSLEELADAYNHQFTEEQLQDVEAHKDDIIQYFHDNTQTISLNNGGYLISEF